MNDSLSSFIEYIFKKKKIYFILIGQEVKWKRERGRDQERSRSQDRTQTQVAPKHNGFRIFWDEINVIK